MYIMIFFGTSEPYLIKNRYNNTHYFTLGEIDIPFNINTIFPNQTTISTNRREVLINVLTRKLCCSVEDVSRRRIFIIDIRPDFTFLLESIYDYFKLTDNEFDLVKNAKTIYDREQIINQILE